MASPYTLSNRQLQALASGVAVRYRLLVAGFNPVQLTVASQDVQTNQYGQYDVLPSVDLLLDHEAPWAPQPNFGPNRIAYAGEALFFDGSASSQRGNLPAFDHQWSFADAASVSYSTGPYGGSNSQASVVWTTTGIKTVTLTVRDRWGGVTTGIRQVLVLPARTSAPSGITAVAQVSGSTSGGGWQAQVTCALGPDGRQALNLPLPDELPVGAYVPVVLYVETEYELSPGVWTRLDLGPESQVVPGQPYRDPRILLAGYIVGGSASEDASVDSVTYSIASVNSILSVAGIHNIGYYTTDYTFIGLSQTPTSTASRYGSGQLVQDLTSEDVYRSLFAAHSNAGTYHDLRLFRVPLPGMNGGTGGPATPLSASSQPLYWTYTTLTANEGSVWDAANTLAQNEWCSLYVEHDGTICVAPQWNLHGSELVATSTVYHQLPGGYPQILNASTEIAQVAAHHYSDPGVFNPGVPPWQLEFWGPTPQPVAREGASDTYVRDLSGLVGPPVVLHLADVPVYDPAWFAPPDPELLSAVTANWPQDLAVHPAELDIQLNFATRDAFVKLIASLVSGNVWSAWAPAGTFSCSGLLQDTIAAGAWDVQQSLLLPDQCAVLAADKGARLWLALWEYARRYLRDHNKAYSIAATTTAPLPFLRLGDLIQVTRQRAVTGPVLVAMPAQVTSITHTLDLNAGVWTTQIAADECTYQQLGAPLAVPCPQPPLSA